MKKLATVVGCIGFLGALSLRCSPSGEAPGAGETGGTWSAGGRPTGSGGGGASGSGGAGSGGASSAAGAGGASSAGGSGEAVHDCSDVPELALTGSVLTPVVLPGQTAPAPAGGTIPDGTYDATAFVLYGDFDLANLAGNFQQTMRLRDGFVDIVRSDANMQNDRSTYSFVSDGAMLHLDAHCPAEILGWQDAWAFSAFPDHFDSYAEIGVTVIVTYTKRTD